MVTLRAVYALLSTIVLLGPTTAQCPATSTVTHVTTINITVRPPNGQAEGVVTETITETVTAASSGAAVPWSMPVSVITSGGETITVWTTKSIYVPDCSATDAAGSAQCQSITSTASQNALSVLCEAMTGDITSKPYPCWTVTKPNAESVLCEALTGFDKTYCSASMSKRALASSSRHLKSPHKALASGSVHTTGTRAEQPDSSSSSVNVGGVIASLLASSSDPAAQATSTDPAGVIASLLGTTAPAEPGAGSCASAHTSTTTIVSTVKITSPRPSHRSTVTTVISVVIFTTSGSTTAILYSPPESTHESKSQSSSSHLAKVTPSSTTSFSHKFVPPLVVGLMTVTPNSKSEYVLGTQTLSRGGVPIIFNSQTVSLGKGGHSVFFNGKPSSIISPKIIHKSSSTITGHRIPDSVSSSSVTDSSSGSGPNPPGVGCTWPWGLCDNFWNSTSKTVMCTPPCTFQLPPLKLGSETTFNASTYTSSICQVITTDSQTITAQSTFVFTVPSFTTNEIQFIPLTFNSSDSGASITPLPSIAAPKYGQIVPDHDILCPPLHYQVSPDGSCGSRVNYRCPKGQCCNNGQCGTDSKHCDCHNGCEWNYGTCNCTFPILIWAKSTASKTLEVQPMATWKPTCWPLCPWPDLIPKIGFIWFKIPTIHWPKLKFPKCVDLIIIRIGCPRTSKSGADPCEATDGTCSDFACDGGCNLLGCGCGFLGTHKCPSGGCCDKWCSQEPPQASLSAETFGNPTETPQPERPSLSAEIFGNPDPTPYPTETPQPERPSSTESAACPLASNVVVSPDDDQGEDGLPPAACPLAGNVTVSPDDDQGEDGTPPKASCPLGQNVTFSPNDDQGEDGTPPPLDDSTTSSKTTAASPASRISVHIPKTTASKNIGGLLSDIGSVAHSSTASSENIGGLLSDIGSIAHSSSKSGPALWAPAGKTTTDIGSVPPNEVEFPSVSIGSTTRDGSVLFIDITTEIFQTINPKTHGPIIGFNPLTQLWLLKLLPTLRGGGGGLGQLPLWADCTPALTAEPPWGTCLPCYTSSLGPCTLSRFFDDGGGHGDSIEKTTCLCPDAPSGNPTPVSLCSQAVCPNQIVDWPASGSPTCNTSLYPEIVLRTIAIECDVPIPSPVITGSSQPSGTNWNEGFR